MIVKRIAALLALALLLLPAAVAAAPETEAAPIPDEDRFGGKDWDAIMAEFIAAHGAFPSRMGAAYYNTVTGEEHYFNGDQYRYAASVYKLPLNMVYAERVYRGEMQMDDRIGGWTYGEMQRLSLELSSNSVSELLCGHLGTRQQYCEAIAAYLADDPSDLDAEFYYKCYTNSLTPAQVMCALKKLYAAPDRYPNVLEHMKSAQQKEYFCLTERRFPIAHKYGCLLTEEANTVNDCGIVYTDDPILIVMFTGNMPGAFRLLGDYCTLMCDYAQYTRAVRLRAEAEVAAAEQARIDAEAAEKAAAEAAEKAERQRLAAEAAAAEKAAAERARLEAENAPWSPDREERRLLYAAGAAAGLCLVAAPFFWFEPKKSSGQEAEKCTKEND